MEWEAYRITARRNKEVRKARQRYKQAEKKARHATRRASRVQHDLCEGCGSRLKEYGKRGVPVCEAGCHELWKGLGGEGHKKRRSKEGKKEDKVHIDDIAKQETGKEKTWDEIADRYLGKSRSSRVTAGTLCDPSTAD